MVNDVLCELLNKNETTMCKNKNLFDFSKEELDEMKKNVEHLPDDDQRKINVMDSLSVLDPRKVRKQMIKAHLFHGTIIIILCVCFGLATAKLMYYSSILGWISVVVLGFILNKRTMHLKISGLFRPLSWKFSLFGFAGLTILLDLYFLDTFSWFLDRFYVTGYFGIFVFFILFLSAEKHYFKD